MSADKVLVATLMGLWLFPEWGFCLTAREVEDRLSRLEEEASIAQEQIYETEQQFDGLMKITGYTDVEYRVSTQKEFQSEFRLHHLSLFFEKALSGNWRFYSEIEYEDAPKFESDGSQEEVLNPDSDPVKVRLFKAANGKIFVEAVNLSYLWKPIVNLRLGRFFTPAGIWSVDHYPPFVPTQERPKHIRQIFPQYVDGITVFGTVPLGTSFLNYDLYLGNGEGNTGKEDANTEKAAGIKATFVFPAIKHLEIGGSSYNDILNGNTKKSALGMHAKFTLSGSTLQAEYARAAYTPSALGESPFNSLGYYVQFAYNINRWTVGYRYDYYDRSDRPADDDEVTIHGLFGNYRLNASVVIKLEHHLNKYQYEKENQQNFQKSILSIVAYLG